MKTLLTIILILTLATVARAAYQISCPSENIVALNQSNQSTQQVLVNGAMVSQTVNYDVPYFNKIFNATDCSIKQIANPTPAQSASLLAQAANAKQAASINAQMEANREAYVDALMSGDTAAQQSIAAAQATLKSQKAAL